MVVWWGEKGVFDVNLVLDFKKTKKSHLEDSPAVPFLGQGLGCKGRKSHEQRCACGGKRRHVPDFHRFSRRFYAASVSEASWCLEIGLTLGSIQLTGSCPRSIPADAQLRKELQIIWKRHMANVKGVSSFWKKHVFPSPLHISLPMSSLFCFFWNFRYIGRFGSGSGMPHGYSGYILWHICIRVERLERIVWRLCQVWVCIHLHAWTLLHDTQDQNNNKKMPRYFFDIAMAFFFGEVVFRWIFQWDCLWATL